MVDLNNLKKDQGMQNLIELKLAELAIRQAVLEEFLILEKKLITQEEYEVKINQKVEKWQQLVKKQLEEQE